MILAVTFNRVWLLLGLAATFIPFVLHLLSSVRAREVYFPTLRFLRRSMEKTARRRRIQHWLLLLLRAGLLALLCLSVAEPQSKPSGGWLGGDGDGYVASVILDNSLSMAAEDGGSSRFSRARAGVQTLLHDKNKPKLASLHVTNGAARTESLTADIGSLRKQIDATRIVAARAEIKTHLEDALALLKEETAPRKSVFIFSDLQRLSFDRLQDAQELAGAKDVHLMIVNTGTQELTNVGVSALEIAGQRVASAPLTFTATLINSSATNQVVDVGLRVGDRTVLPMVRKALKPADSQGGGSSGTVQFQYRFRKPGAYTGGVFIEQADDLRADNVRRFHLDIGGPVEALVVRGPTDIGGALSTDPVMTLSLALNPYGDAPVPWPVQAEVIDAQNLDEDKLKAKDVVFLCEVPTFSDRQIRAVAEFVKGGATAVFFLGPGVQAESYNRHFLASGTGTQTSDLLPAKILEPVGQIGPEAKAQFVEKIELTSRYIRGLYTAEGEAGYRAIQVQRYFRLEPRPSAETLIRLDNKDPLVLLRDFGDGKVVLFATTASPRWSTLCLNGLFLPLVNRVSLLSRKQTVDQIYAAGATVPLRPGPIKAGPNVDVFVKITPPTQTGQPGEPVRLKVDRKSSPPGVDYVAERLGVYTWQLLSPHPDDQNAGVHQFVVNPDQEESDLRAFKAETLTGRLADRYGLERVYIAHSLNGVLALAGQHSQGFPWWDILAGAAIIVLVAEAAVANRATRRDEDLIPAHLNVRLAA